MGKRIPRSIFESNAAAIETLQADVRRTCRDRDLGPQERLRWTQACKKFRTDYDRLAFPGGAEAAIRRARGLDPETMEQAIHFLEVDPWFFRSGYLKEEFLRALKRAPLHLRQRTRLRNIILARIAGPGRREFRLYCHVAREVSSPAFVRRIQDLATSRDPGIARRASWVLQAIGAAAPQIGMAPT